MALVWKRVRVQKRHGTEADNPWQFSEEAAILALTESLPYFFSFTLLAELATLDQRSRDEVPLRAGCERVCWGTSRMVQPPPESRNGDWLAQGPSLDELPPSLPALLPVLDDCSDGIALTTPPNWRIIYANPSLSTWLGCSPSSLHGRSVADFLELFPSDSLAKGLESVCREGPYQAAASGSMLTGDKSIPIHLRIRRLCLDRQVFVCITVQRCVLSEGQDMSSRGGRDPLTGLLNRSFLLSRLDELLHGERSADQRFAVLFVDVNDFKPINDSYGHLLGDRVLSEVARRLTHSVRAHDHVVRFGGDEFVVLAEQVSVPSDVDSIVRRIHEVLERSIELPQGEVTLTVSIGVAFASAEHRSPEDLLAAADRAMYAAKRSLS